jgi:hypothetical protein
MEIFNGGPQDARDFFGVHRLSGLYDRLDEKPARSWHEEWKARHGNTSTIPPQRARRSTVEKRHSALVSLGILLARQLAILRSDWKNFAILLGQPVVLAALVSWASNEHSLLLFFAYIATLWFGCSNAAQEIVREIAIYRRERVVGMSRAAYVASKFIFLGLMTTVQSLLFYLCLQAGEGGLQGSPLWQCAGLLGTALASVAIGTIISALARTVMQAVITVPLALIPLILFSGYTVPAHEMKPSVAAVSRFTPTFAAQRCMDISFLWGKKIARDTLSDHWTSFRNLNRASPLRTGETFLQPGPGTEALAMQMAWVAAGYVLALLALRAREKA